MNYENLELKNRQIRKGDNEDERIFKSSIKQNNKQ